MRDFLLYLAGSIIGNSYEEAIVWRKYVAERLPSNIICLSPLRNKHFLSGAGTINRFGSWQKHPLTSDAGITCRDRFDVRRSDVILFNFLGAEVGSIGSSIEFGWADAWRKPIVVVMENNNIHSHPIIRELAGFIVPELDQAIEIVKAVLLPNS
jgi:hypothetical protein